jgi:ribosome-associated protein
MARKFHPPPDDTDEPEADDGPSRTQRKNASLELTQLGEQMVDLRAERLAELALPEQLQDAIVEAKRLKSFGAKRRQAQYIGKILRKLDDEMLAAIRKAVARR